jgi:hypothetical protein
MGVAAAEGKGTVTSAAASAGAASGAAPTGSGAGCSAAAAAGTASALLMGAALMRGRGERGPRRPCSAGAAEVVDVELLLLLLRDEGGASCSEDRDGRGGKGATAVALLAALDCSSKEGCVEA